MEPRYHGLGNAPGVRMGRSKRNSPKGAADRIGHWLGSERSGRSRPWAYHGLLLGSSDDRTEDDELRSLEAELAVDLTDLKRMHDELYDHVVRIARLEGQIQERMSSPDVQRQAPAQMPTAPEIPSFPSASVRSETALKRERSLARCEGFDVESPGGYVGIVEGLRFGSRIDVPDLLEVRGGRFGRELMLIPIEAVAEVSVEEERLVVRGSVPSEEDHAHEFVDRLRKALHVMTASFR
jgi:hypothetical protein